MHNVNQRNFATTAQAAAAQSEAEAVVKRDLTEGEELLLAHGFGEYPSAVDPSTADERRFSQAPPSQEVVSSLLGSITVIEALGTVLDLSFLVDDVSPEEAAARNLIGAIVASTARIIKSNLDQADTES